MANQTTLADYLAELGVDVNNMQEFLNKLSQMLSSASDTVTISQTLQDGTKKDFVVPSFAYLKNKILSLDDKFNALLTGNAGRIAVKDENGQIKTFELQDIATVVNNLETVNTKTVPSPTNFQYKPNWFFESFLNPLIYIDVPVDNIATQEIDKFEVSRIIVSSTDQIEADYFDSTYKGKNGIAYNDLINDLNARGIAFFEDINEVELPPSQNSKAGSFDILNSLSDTSAQIVAGQTLTTTITKYILNTLRYHEKTSSAPNGVIQKTLKAGDFLMTPDNSEYKVIGVDANQKSVILERTFGIGDLTVGANRLMIKPEIKQITNLSINLGFNEREVIFLRPISTRLKVTTQRHSQGFGIFTNELTITLSNGQSQTLADFYNKFVSDFGMIFLNYAKEKRIAASLGAVPNQTVLSAASFKVVQEDAHIQESDNISQVTQNISAIETLKSQTREIDKQISDRRAELNTNAALTEAQQLKINKDLATLSDTRKTLSNDLSSKINSVTTAVKSTPNLIKDPTYRVKGFWHIPDPVSTAHGLQQVVQFKVAYRVLSKTGTAQKAEQLVFTDPNGNRITGTFSPWKEMLTKPKTKKYNDLSGFYEWAPEDVANPETVNANQVDLPIAKGQVLEIKVKSLSEAGWPENPVESDWSNVITVEFPAEMKTLEDVSVLSQQVFAEQTKVNFLDELNAKGLDVHLGSSFTSRDKYFAHRAEDIASGFFSTDGSIIDLFTKLKSISDTLSAIQTSLASGTGELKVTIIDQLGNEVSVTKGHTINIFAGYYKDQIKVANRATTTYDNGKIITNQYILKLENTSQTPLQLISTLNGGIGERPDSSDPFAHSGDSYHTSLRYDRAPISIHSNAPGTIGDLRQIDGFQSSQVKGQIAYVRSKAINLSTNLVDGDGLATPATVGGPVDTMTFGFTSIANYDYKGQLFSNSTVPYANGHYLPFDPTLTALTVSYKNSTRVLNANSGVWNGLFDSNLAPTGNGLLSEFCISVDHPDIKKGGPYNNTTWSQIKKPTYQSSDTTQKTLPFSHAPHFETAFTELTNEFGIKYFEQASYRAPAAIVTGAMTEDMYPTKLGFVPNDRYLIGKYTCGAYLYIAPESHSQISATSFSPSSSSRTVSFGTGNAINIPITFQYRCSDYKGYVGGYRVGFAGGFKNVKYVKKMGIDIYLKDQTFSFDIEISAQYEKETSVVTPITPIANSNPLTSGITYSSHPPIGHWWVNYHTPFNIAGGRSYFNNII